MLSTLPIALLTTQYNVYHGLWHLRHVVYYGTEVEYYDGGKWLIVTEEMERTFGFKYIDHDMLDDDRQQAFATYAKENGYVE